MGTPQNSSEIVEQYILLDHAPPPSVDHRVARFAGMVGAVDQGDAEFTGAHHHGAMKQVWRSQQSSPRHLTEILDNMTELYTSAGGVFLGAEYANRDGKNERRDINQPCLCVYGTTSTSLFWIAILSYNFVYC